jgi:hypothetical protein
MAQIVFRGTGSESVGRFKQRGYTGLVLVGTFPVQPSLGCPASGGLSVARPALVTDRSRVGE